MKQYDQLVDWYACHRNPDIGIGDISRFVSTLPKGSTILDLGCGDGIPISRFLLESEFTVYGIDSSACMVEKFTQSCPGMQVECANLLQSAFFSMKFDAIVAYGLMFHFPPDDQKTVIARMSEHLNEAGRVLFNSGTEDGETVSVMNGVEVPHWSMSADRYADVLRKNGLVLLNDYTDEQAGTHIYIAQKKATGS
jgi:2-polyprenyl-3-methyl-5-hydroxy-6-metoxy-1,4-benzoquinol methylase